MRGPNFDHTDDPRQSPQPAAEESLDVFADETPKPSSGPLDVPLPEKVTIVELEKWPDDRSPLDAFALERRVEPRPLNAAAGFELPERSERFEQPERFERPEHFERSERFQRFAGFAGLAAVAVITLVTLNWAQGFVAPQPEAPAQARVDNPPEPPVAHESTPNATDRNATLSEPVIAPAAESGLAPRTELPVVPTTTAQPLNRKPAPTAPSRPVNQPARAPARVVVEPPSRAQRAEIVTPRVVESAPPPPAQVPTTGVTPVERRGIPSTSTPIVSTLGATAAAPTPPVAAPPTPALTPVAAPAASPLAAEAAARGAVPRAAVESVLGRYARAFSSLDAQSAKAVWPNVNQRSLERAFDSLEQQDFDLGACDITLLPPRALALCDGTARYTPKVGNRKQRTETRRWTFHLSQNGQDWSIESVDTR